MFNAKNNSVNQNQSMPNDNGDSDLGTNSVINTSQNVVNE